MAWSGMGFLDLGGLFFLLYIGVAFLLDFDLLPATSEADIAC